MSEKQKKGKEQGLDEGASFDKMFDEVFGLTAKPTNINAPGTLKSTESETPEDYTEEAETLRPEAETPDIEIIESIQGDVEVALRFLNAEDIAESIREYDFEFIIITAPGSALGHILYQRICAECKNEGLEFKLEEDQITILISKRPDVDYTNRIIGKSAVAMFTALQRSFPESLTLT